MRHRIGLIVLFGCLAAVGEGQPVAKFALQEKTLGQVLWKQPVTIHYDISNAGNEPLVIERVEPSCACTVAGWTRGQIAPQKHGEISVSYDAKMLGHFNKDVAVYTNASDKPVFLSFRGETVTEIQEDETNYPYQIGSLRLDRSSIEFDDVHVGDKPSVEVKVMNGTGEAYTPVLMHLPPYLTAVAIPEQIGKNLVGKIKVTLDTEKLPKLGLNTASVYLARYPGDTVGKENELSVSVISLPDFSGLTEVDRRFKPEAVLSTKELNVGEIAPYEVKKGSVEVRNNGKSDLEIQEVQVFNSAVGVQLNKRVLPPGKKAKLKITVYGVNLDKVKGTPRVLLITNDPDHPKVIVKVKATLKK